ncbi:hypothetical protein ACFO9Q_12645 [Paenibacillus sp. GCM10023252]|uniref:hypothetical protein n=1 Tax=Paenibacillus sp. GCM10023252 TaxID=3252649 RepID=UPI00361AFD01
MNIEYKTAILQKVKAMGMIKDPQWLDRLDEPVPLWVMLEMMVQLMERLDPPNKPYD